MMSEANTFVPPVWSEAELRSAIAAAGVALWSWNVDSDRFVMDQRAYDLWAIPDAIEVTFEDLSQNIHPKDRDRVRAAFAATRALIGAYEIDFRIIIEEEIRWISARGQGDDAGIVNRVMSGIFLDVTGRKQAEEANELLAGEMGHRVKNLLAIASGLTSITSRSTATVAEMTEQLTSRLAALGRAHDLVRPLPGHEGRAALLGDLLSVLLAPYDDMGAFSGRIRVSVPRMGVGQAAATALALIVHELATNSVKYGALSMDTGTLDLTCHPGERVIITWAERGGPPVHGPAERDGFGSSIIYRTLSSQLDGTLDIDWPREGVVVTLNLNKARLAL